MAVAEQAELVVALKLKDQTSGPVAKLQGNLKRLNEQTQTLQQGLGKIGSGLRLGFQRAAVGAAAAAGFLALQIRSGINSLVELERTTDQTTRILEGLGKRTDITAQQVRDLSVALEDQTAVDDKLIQRGINLGLQFGKLRKNQLEPFAETALDISEATGTDATSAFRNLAAALADPERRLALLDRTTKAFSARQIEQIQNLAKQNRLGEAQARILGILNNKYGGAASRGQDSFRKNTARLNDAIEELQMNLAAPLLRPLTRLTRRLAEFAASDEVKQGLTDLGNGIAALFSDENITAGVGTIKSGFAFLRDLPWASIKDGLQTTADVAKKAVDLFKSLPPELQTGLVTLLAANKLTGGLVASGIGDLAGLLLRNLTTINAAVVNVMGGTVNTGGGGIPAPGTPGRGGGGGRVGGILRGVGGILGGAALLGFGTQADLIDPSDPRYIELERRRRLAAQRRDISDRMFRPGIITGLPGKTPGLKPELSPRQQLANQFAGTQTLIRAIMASGGQASPGQGGQKLQGIVIDKLSTLAALGDKQNEKAANIWERLGTGNMTYAEANKKLTQLLTKTDTQTTAIREQKTDVNLSPQINISAAQTGNAITLAATGSRIVIR